MHQDMSLQGHVSERQHLNQLRLLLLAVLLCFPLQGHLHHLVQYTPVEGLNLYNYKPHPLYIYEKRGTRVQSRRIGKKKEIRSTNKMTNSITSHFISSFSHPITGLKEV